MILCKTKNYAFFLATLADFFYLCNIILIALPLCSGVKADLYCCERITCYGVPLQWVFTQVTYQTMEIVVLAGFL
ncbi:hypothetical protein HMPREF1254_0694 [Prevotella sp. BV3P1]|nr:hypothetical protein HMPREF1254_0694 [Prevotella sp. BV3P1]